MARYQRVIVQESQRLGLLIANLLDYAQIEKGTRRYTPTRQEIGPLARHAVSTFESLRHPEGARNSIQVAVSEDGGAGRGRGRSRRGGAGAAQPARERRQVRRHGAPDRGERGRGRGGGVDRGARSRAGHPAGGAGADLPRVLPRARGVLLERRGHGPGARAGQAPRRGAGRARSRWPRRWGRAPRLRSGCRARGRRSRDPQRRPHPRRRGRPVDPHGARGHVYGQGLRGRRGGAAASRARTARSAGATICASST